MPPRKIYYGPSRARETRRVGQNVTAMIDDGDTVSCYSRIGVYDDCSVRARGIREFHDPAAPGCIASKTTENDVFSRQSCTSDNDSFARVPSLVVSSDGIQISLETLVTTTRIIISLLGTIPPFIRIDTSRADRSSCGLEDLTHDNFIVCINFK